MGDSSSFIKIGPAGSGVITKQQMSDVYDELDEFYGGQFDDELLVFDKREAWDEKGRGIISQIFIWHSKDGINSIQFNYPRDRNVFDRTQSVRFFMSERHGTGNGTKFDVVNFDCISNEYITSIRGHTTTKDILCSITFCTKLGQYGPFGGRLSGDEEFNFRLGQGTDFAGFYGAFNKTNITGIGFYMKPHQ